MEIEYLQCLLYYLEDVSEKKVETLHKDTLIEIVKLAIVARQHQETLG